MPRCHLDGSYVTWDKDCADCHTRSCPVNTGFADGPLPDEETNEEAQNKLADRE